MLIQYVDDLLLCSETKQACEVDTRALLVFLAENGHKVSKKKLQLVSQSIKYLGRDITPNGRKLDLERVAAILSVPQPVTKQHMLTLTGMAGYCRAWLPDYAEVVQPLSDLIHGHKMAMNDKIQWTPEGLEAFDKLKQLLTSSPRLGLPDHSKPFNLFVCETKGFMSSVLTQDKWWEAEAFCLLSQVRTAHLTPARLLHYQNVSLKRCTVLNPATLLPTDDDGDPHDCAVLVDQVCKPRPHLSDVPLMNSDLELFVDGSAPKSPQGEPLVAYAVTMAATTLESATLPPHLSAQAAELFALTRACILAKNKTVMIYSDSRYAFGVLHDFGTLWKQRGFLNSSGNAVADMAAKATATSTVSSTLQMVSLPVFVKNMFSLQDVSDLKLGAGPGEVRQWRNTMGVKIPITNLLCSCVRAYKYMDCVPNGSLFPV
ncbi:uncharacterized protein LOC121581603 [Coregonus clupeaformis]|uniref:uncharacterized protein LOC121581603 n=1 Tax=Coregonus clupeaformis TaxID=59861 RepID=UPI001BDFD45D|nr:uncharacterized protein LOC121581603 [Coregonus clupeaformis]